MKVKKSVENGKELMTLEFNHHEETVEEGLNKLDDKLKASVVNFYKSANSPILATTESVSKLVAVKPNPDGSDPKSSTYIGEVTYGDIKNIVLRNVKCRNDTVHIDDYQTFDHYLIKHPFTEQSINLYKDKISSLHLIEPYVSTIDDGDDDVIHSIVLYQSNVECGEIIGNTVIANTKMKVGAIGRSIITNPKLSSLDYGAMMIGDSYIDSSSFTKVDTIQNSTITYSTYLHSVSVYDCDIDRSVINVNHPHVGCLTNTLINKSLLMCDYLTVDGNQRVSIHRTNIEDKTASIYLKSSFDIGRFMYGSVELSFYVNYDDNLMVAPIQGVKFVEINKQASDNEILDGVELIVNGQGTYVNNLQIKVNENEIKRSMIKALFEQIKSRLITLKTIDTIQFVNPSEDFY